MGGAMQTTSLRVPGTAPSVPLASLQDERDEDARSAIAQTQDEIALPVLLGRQPGEAQTLPNLRTREEVQLLRRRRRRHTATIRDTQVFLDALATPSNIEATLHDFSIEEDAWPMPFLRPPRVILTTPA